MSRFTRAKLDSRLITLEIASFNVKPSKVEVPRRLTRKPHSMRMPFIIVLGMAALMFAATRLVLVAGVDPHTVMAWSGHRTANMLRRYHIIDLEDLRWAGKRASDYRGPKENVAKDDFGRTVPKPSQSDGNPRGA